MAVHLVPIRGGKFVRIESPDPITAQRDAENYFRSHKEDQAQLSQMHEANGLDILCRSWSCGFGRGRACLRQGC